MRFLLFSFSVLILLASCRRDIDANQELDNLKISTDTVFFDTVFTAVGSATEVFLIQNTSSDILKIDEIRLASGGKSFYMLNLDGVPSDIFTDVEIAPKDSLYFFVEVNIDPNTITTPFVVKDSIIFKSGKKQNDVKLISWGRNGVFHKNDTIRENTTWQANVPHIIFNDLHIINGAKLTLSPGAEVYGHSFSRINVWRGASIESNGSIGNPVIFQGDRTEDRYKEEPGQWIGIRIRPGALASSFTNTIIKNGFIGLQVDSMPPSGETNVFIENTTISTMNLYGILAYSGSIQAINLEINNCCEYLFAAEFGGNYNLIYSTLGNFQKSCARTTGSLYLSNDSFKNADGQIFVNDLNFNFINSILYGGQDEEIDLYNGPLGDFNLAINNSILKTQIEAFNTNYNLINKDPKFVNPSQLNYQLDTLSPAIGKASPIPQIQMDYFGNIRSSTAPDIGAFERQE